MLYIALPGASKEELEVTARGTDLLVRVRDAYRLVALPDSVAGRPVRSAQFVDGTLEVQFEK